MALPAPNSELLQAKHREYAANVRVWAKIDGVEYEAVSAHVFYAINAIPYCALNLNVGVDAKTKKPSAIHAAQDKIQSRMSAQVYCELEKTETTTQFIPEGQFLIFEGYTAGRPGITKNASGQASFTLYLIGWLSDLHRTSVVNAAVTPEAPDNLFVGLGFNFDPSNAFASIVAVSGLADHLGDFPDDIWEALKMVFTALASAQIPIPGLGDDGFDNTAAITAMDRFNRFEIKNVPLKLVDAIVPFVKEIKAQVGAQVFSLVQGSTVWSKLLMMAELLDFAIIPTVYSATLAPHVAAISTPFAEISTREAFLLSIEPFQQRNLAGLVLIQYGVSNTNSFQTSASFRPQIVGSSPIAKDAQGKPDGLITFKAAPPWLTTEFASGIDNTQASLNLSAGEGMPNALKPDPDFVGPPAPVPAAELRDQLGDAGNLMAQHYFNIERFKNRVGVIVGRIRFDIAPGSCIRLIDAPTELNLLGAGNDILANVQGVEYLFDAAGKTAATTLVLNSIRSARIGDEIGLSSHPMYTEVWNGTELLPDTE